MLSDAQIGQKHIEPDLMTALMDYCGASLYLLVLRFSSSMHNIH